MEIDAPKSRVLICDPFHQDGIALLQTVAEVDFRPGISQHELLLALPDFAGIILGNRLQLKKKAIKRAIQLQVIAHTGARLENVDILAASRAEIELVNSPGARTIAVAEHTMALLLAVARRLPTANQQTQQGQLVSEGAWGSGLAGKALGIIGYGRIGQQTAKRARAFEMQILVNQIEQTDELTLDEEAGIIQRVDLNDLLGAADYVSLHVPYNKETRHLIGVEQLARMKASAILINTAHAKTVDEKALLAALDAGEIAGAALDVFDPKRGKGSALAQHQRVIATPHIAGSSAEAGQIAAVNIAEKMIPLLRFVEPTAILPLRFVPSENVIPHEAFDQKRVDRLKKRLADEITLNNPPIVMPAGDGQYVVLDGATRTTALNQLGIPHMAVQIIDSGDGLELKTWFHVIHQMPAADLFNTLDALPLVSLRKTEPKKAQEDLLLDDALCYLHTVENQVFMVYPTPGARRLAALNSLTETYIDQANVSRTLENDVLHLQRLYPDMSALVVFPELTVEYVLQVVKSGRYVPAGITRFVIPGRILRAGIEMDVMRSQTMSLREKNIWLQQMLQQKEGAGSIRFYQEPVYLLDE